MTFKLAYVSPSFYPAIKYGGPIFSTLHTCEEFAKIGVKVYVSTTNTNADSRLAVKTGFFIEHLPNMYIKYYNETLVGKISLSLVCGLWKDIKQADVVHIQAIFNSPVPIALLYASICKKPTFLSSRGALASWGLKEKKTLWKKIWLALLIRPFANRITWHATSEAEKKDILAIYKSARVMVIPNGVSFDSLKPVSLDNKGFNLRFGGHDSEKNPIIVTMARLHYVKGIDILIQSFANIRKTFPNAVLYIAGPDGGELQNLKKIAAELGLNHAVFFTGNLEGQDKADFLGNADVFVLPSHTENFGIVYAEALASGTPIVAGSNTPWEEIDSAGCGRHVPNTIEDTTNAMLDLLGRDREELRQNALKYVQKYDWKNIAKQFKEQYDNALDNSGPN